MPIDPTREEWLEAMRRVTAARGTPIRKITEAALGSPCPPEPEPVPEPFIKAGRPLVWASPGPGRVHIPGFALTPDEAKVMAAVLIEHAAYAREQGATPSRNAPVAGPLIPAPICGRLLAQGKGPWDPLCQRPKGHSLPCAAEPNPRDAVYRGPPSDPPPEATIAHGTNRILGPTCGRVLDRKPSDTSAKVCQRPKGHDGYCCRDGD